jgi:hypothetical protein
VVRVVRETPWPTGCKSIGHGASAMKFFTSSNRKINGDSLGRCSLSNHFLHPLSVILMPPF